MKSTLRLAIALVVLVLGTLVYWRHGDRFFAEAPKPPEVRYSEETRKCLITHVADDGTTPTQHRFMAHAVLNLADETGMSVCRIHREKVALSAPSQDGKKVPRLTEAAELLEKAPLVGDKANYARVELEVDRILKDRKDDYRKEPCLAFVTRYKRPPKWGTWQNEEKFREELDLLYDDGQGARFYGPKGSKSKCS